MLLQLPDGSHGDGGIHPNCRATRCIGLRQCAGKIDFKVDKYGIIHTAVGKISFTPEQIVENAKEVVNTIIKLKPSAAKGTYVLSIYLSTTMSPGLQIDPKSVETK